MITSLYADHRASVLSYVTTLLKDRHLAEDVVQETMLRAWRHRGRFSAEKGSVRGWLMTVAHNIAMDKIRMRQSRPAEVPEDAVPEALITLDHADAVVASVQVRQALARLSPGHRDVLEQLYLYGYTAREAAARLGIPEGTVFSRSYYALRILRVSTEKSSPLPSLVDSTRLGPSGITPIVRWTVILAVLRVEPTCVRGPCARPESRRPSPTLAS